MESKLIQGLFEHPGVINRRSEHHLRYALALAALDVFQPGAAKKGGRTKRPDIKVRSPQLAGWRRRVLTTLGPILIDTQDSRERVELANQALYSMLPTLEKTRNEVIKNTSTTSAPASSIKNSGSKPSSPSRVGGAVPVTSISAHGQSFKTQG